MENEHKEMEALLKAELDQEAQAILDEIEADESLKDLTLPAENDEALMQKIKEAEEKKAAYEKLSEKDKEALRLGREMQAQKEHVPDAEKKMDETEETENLVPFKKRRKKLYILVAVVAIMVLAMSMTSIGEVPLVTKIRKQLIGESEIVRVSSQRENEAGMAEETDREAEAYKEIKNEFDTEIVCLEYLPEDTELLDYDIDTNLNKVSILYQCQGNIIEYKMIFNYKTQVFSYEVEDELLEERELKVNGIPIHLKQYELEESGEKQAVAQFEYQNIYYVLSGNISIEEMETILKNLKIF